MPVLSSLLLTLPLLLSPPAHALDTGPWQAVLSAHVNSRSRVDYAAIHDSAALDSYLLALSQATEPPAGPDRIAFWINAYNALTVDLIADNWPLASITDLDEGKVWDRRSFTVAGQQVTLNDIEHKRLRPFTDGRIHAAVNCASRGCPPLARTVFTGSGLESQLDAAAEHWLGSNAVTIDRSAGTVQFSSIFDWYAEDFDGDSPVAPPADLSGKLAQAAAWVAARTDQDTAALLSAGGYTASWQTYSWSVNSQ